MVTTPANAVATPAARFQLSLSSWVKTWAIKSAKIGVAALRIEAWPLEIRVSAKAIRAKGRVLETMPSPVSSAQRRGEAAIQPPLKRAISSSAAAAIDSRPSTMVTGGSSVTSTLKKKKEAPHNTDRATSIPHSTAPRVGFSRTRQPSRFVLSRSSAPCRM